MRLVVIKPFCFSLNMESSLGIEPRSSGSQPDNLPLIYEDVVFVPRQNTTRAIVIVSPILYTVISEAVCLLISETRFELVISWLQTKRITRLSYTLFLIATCINLTSSLLLPYFLLRYHH